ncbi:MAG: hybrid sensor histidine kinase/response regulator [Bacteroidales bacterium]|nr:hybrid sensor histidine kinase/response regulator [Bacteroidales bacterium]MCF8334692.1 hybrid sensor histidine kinase/response regulator [Bacteroidales bacterium]
MSVLKLLVVDDEPGIRSGVSRILRNFKVDYPFMDEHIEFEILEEADGESALETIRAKKPEIILLDNKLPGIQGVDVLETIKKENINSVVVMITSYASLELAVQATKDGAHDFIPKPFTPQDLRSSVETVTKHIFLKQMTQKLNTEGRQIRFQFLSVLSHELKAPINAVEGYLKMLQDRQFGDDLNNYNQVIDRTMKRIKGMHNLILDMLDLTKVETGNIKRNIKEVNLVDAVYSAVDTMQPYAIQRDVDIHVNGPENAPLKADPEELETIFNNLISNAIKYNKENGRVDVNIREQKDNFSIQIADTGIGMDETELSKLFKDFVRIKNEKTKNISGSGLGLSIVKKLVNSYNGDINVNSKPDEGSIFTLTFPKEN